MSEFTFWRWVDNPQGQRFHCTRERLVERFRTPIITDSKERLPGWSPSTFQGDYRTKDNVESSCGIGFDVDGEGTDFDTVAEDLGDLAGFLYTSYRHTPDRHRARAILWTSRLVTSEEYPRCWRFGTRRLPTVGREAKDSSRLWFVPGVAPRGEYRITELTGALLDVDEALASIPEEPEETAAPYEPVKATTPVIERAQAYLDTCDVAVSGQHGHRTTFIVAQKLVRGFQLSEEIAYKLMTSWNERCDPPWSERDLKRKVKQAAKAGRMEPGKILHAERAT
jgi:hypothetical protein